MGTYGPYLLGNGSPIQSWTWLRLVYGIGLGYSKRFSARVKCDRIGDCRLCHLKSSLKVSNVLKPSAGRVSIGFGRH